MTERKILEIVSKIGVTYNKAKIAGQDTDENVKIIFDKFHKDMKGLYTK